MGLAEHGYTQIYTKRSNNTSRINTATRSGIMPESSAPCLESWQPCPRGHAPIVRTAIDGLIVYNLFHVFAHRLPDHNADKQREAQHRMNRRWEA